MAREWERVKRFYDQLQVSRSLPESGLDAAHAFFVFCYHFKDWLKNDPTLDERVRDEVEAFVSSELAVAADIANGVKHLLVTGNHVSTRQRVSTCTPLAWAVASYRKIKNPSGNAS